MTREELRDYVKEQRNLGIISYHVYSTLIDGIDTLEQEPKIGHWIDRRNRATGRFETVCSKCEAEKSYPYNDYCGNCGAKMIEKIC